ncbi:MAG: ThiF family adenylyltransferase [Arthrospira sp. SH-MAG29]|nr:ThiF family adenylyltransferase [Arthrospira sp. SH-MAG29]MBS0016139.1 ThiF family adenylyltransferase [Arthrospira sp. SH-MAG29]
MYLISENALRQIHQHIALDPPERGGALLGPIGKNLISHFILDQNGQTSGASYLPSRTLTCRVQQMEQEMNLEFKGVIHSHPGGLDRPSGPDEEAMREGLQINPHIPCFVAPIVTLLAPRQALRSHELPLGQGKISFYAAYRQGNGIRVETLPMKSIEESEFTPMHQELPSVTHLIETDLGRVQQAFGSYKPPMIFVTEMEGQNIQAGCLNLKGLELLFLFSNTYPTTPPILLATLTDKDTEQVELPWSLQTPAEERLVVALKSVITGGGYYQKVYRPLGKPGLTKDEKIAAIAGWSGCYSETDPQGEAKQLQQSLFARSTGLLSEQISQKRVLVAGTGSVGSYLAEQLVRSGVGGLTLIDPETVETANLCRTTYEIIDIGQPKVKALGRRLLNINPLVQLKLEEKSLLDYQPSEFDKLVQEADLIVATTDDVAAQRIINRFAYFRKKPALFVGLYQGAEGGEVIITMPDKTPCYVCATANRHQFEVQVGKVSNDGDYGSNGRVMGEVALGTDIHHVTSVAVKMALSLLLPETARVKLKGFLNPAIEEGFNYLTMSMVQNYWFYPAVFGETAGQYAYQSVWLTAQSQENCPVCGKVHHRTNPLTVPLAGVKADEIRAVLNTSRV